jgi:heme oxygenase (mycobilin-producing)
VFAVLSKFTIANGPRLAAEVKQAFIDRPHLVESAPGFLRLDVLSPLENPDQIWLLTYWVDEASFKAWYRTHHYQASHQEIPSDLKLVPHSTEIHFFEHICS